MSGKHDGDDDDDDEDNKKRVRENKKGEKDCVWSESLGCLGGGVR